EMGSDASGSVERSDFTFSSCLENLKSGRASLQQPNLPETKKSGRGLRPRPLTKRRLWTRSDDCRNRRSNRHDAGHAQRVAVRRIELCRRLAGRDERARTLEVVLDPGLVEATTVRAAGVEEAHADPAHAERWQRAGEGRDVAALSLQREVERGRAARRRADAREHGVLVF